jgi:hypothetical protein
MLGGYCVLNHDGRAGQTGRCGWRNASGHICDVVFFGCLRRFSAYRFVVYWRKRNSTNPMTHNDEQRDFCRLAAQANLQSSLLAFSTT